MLGVTLAISRVCHPCGSVVNEVVVRFWLGGRLEGKLIATLANSVALGDIGTLSPLGLPELSSSFTLQMSGRTWVDDYNLRSQHLPMISAAGMWLERRNVRLPDFEFFSRNFRPLPNMHR